MIAKLAARGANFKGAGNYYLHDKNAQTSERVVWIETVNLRTADPERALKVMAGTAMERDAIKEAAGIKASGRPSDKVVQTYSLSWHPDEQPTKAEMLEAARESLKVLGIEDRQALIVCHNDEPHPHIHVIVNRVSPADGRLSSTSQEKLKLSRWAEDWEKRHGKVYCEQRVAHNAEREQGRFVKDRSGMSRSTFDALHSAVQGLNDNREAKQAAAELKRDQQRKAAELAAVGRHMHEHYRTELANLGADYRRDKARLKVAHQSERDTLRTEIRQVMRQAMDHPAEAQREEARTLAWREKSFLGRVWNAYDAGRSADSMNRRVAGTIWAAISRSARVEGLNKRRSAQRQAAYHELEARADAQHGDLRQKNDLALAAAFKKFEAARQGTLREYDRERQDYRRLWADRNRANREAWRGFRAKYHPLERERQRHAKQRENLSRIESRLTQSQEGLVKQREPHGRKGGIER